MLEGTIRNISVKLYFYNFDQWFMRRCRSKIGHFVKQSETVCAILVEGIIRGISEKLF